MLKGKTWKGIINQGTLNYVIIQHTYQIDIM